VTSETWFDDEAGPLVRPYTVTKGRTRPARAELTMITMVMAVAEQPDRGMAPEHGDVLRACRHPRSVAEVAAAVGLPLGVVKILLSDLMERGMVISRSPIVDAAASTALLRTLLDRVSNL
jgi:hypothetical protein